MERIRLGKTALLVTELGIGAWQWGDTRFWGYGRGYGENDVRAALEFMLAAHINFLDTAEVYGFGTSERLIGKFLDGQRSSLVIASKFFPFPWRLRRTQLIDALRGSLKRLAIAQLDLYQIHWAFPPVSIEPWMAAMADAVDAGLIRAVGVSNYNAKQTRRAYDALAKRGIPLATNQVPYSLLNRKIEFDGTMQMCRELNVTIIAYSPIAQGILSGKYTPANLPPGLRRARYGRELLARAQPLIGLLREIGQAHGGKTPAQVAINWTICKGTVPIPGVKNVRQAQENIGAAGWRLTADEVAALDAMSDGLQK